MDERGILTGFLMSKLGVALAVVGLMGSCIAMYGSLNRATDIEKLTLIAESTSGALRAASWLPGEVVLEREIPRIGQPFTITIQGSYENHQIVNILVEGRDNVRQILIIEEKVNGGKFEIEGKNPKKMRITKSRKISLEVKV